MNHHEPKPLSIDEWNEIASFQDVREGWGLADNEAGLQLASVCYGAKFDFVTGGPGWAGDLFVIHDDAFGGPPFVFRRVPHGPIERVTYEG